MQAVQTTHYVKQRAVGVCARPKRQRLALVHLVTQERGPEEEARDYPVTGRFEISALLSPHTELERRARGQKDEREYPGLGLVEVGSGGEGGGLGPHGHVVGGNRKEGREQATK